MYRRLVTLMLSFVAVAVLAASSQEPARHDVTIRAKGHKFTPAKFEVTQGDVVRVTLVAEDAVYSFAIDEFRIAKRATPGKPTTFEFRAERSGIWTYYCNLTTDAACKDMKGQLVVAAR